MENKEANIKEADLQEDIFKFLKLSTVHSRITRTHRKEKWQKDKSTSNYQKTGSIS